MTYNSYLIKALRAFRQAKLMICVNGLRCSLGVMKVAVRADLCTSLQFWLNVCILSLALVLATE